MCNKKQAILIASTAQTGKGTETMNLKLFVIVMFSAMLITIGVGNMLTAPAASPCDNGQCTLPQAPVVVPTAPEICDGD